MFVDKFVIKWKNCLKCEIFSIYLYILESTMQLIKMEESGRESWAFGGNTGRNTVFLAGI